jgi:hypothetical protein
VQLTKQEAALLLIFVEDLREAGFVAKAETVVRDLGRWINRLHKVSGIPAEAGPAVVALLLKAEAMSAKVCQLLASGPYGTAWHFSGQGNELVEVADIRSGTTLKAFAEALRQVLAERHGEAVKLP